MDGLVHSELTKLGPLIGLEDSRQLCLMDDRTARIAGGVSTSTAIRCVPFWRPVQEYTTANAEGRPVEHDKCAVRQLVNVAPVQAFRTSY